MNLGIGLFLAAFTRSKSMGAILTGAGVPGAGTGADGDYYYDTSSPLNLYGPKAAGAWPAAVNLFGTAGFTLSDATSAGLTFTPSHNGQNKVVAAAGSILSLLVGATESFRVDGTNVQLAQPLGGLSAPLPFRASALAFSAADITLNGAQNSSPVLNCSGTTGNIITQTVATAAFFIVNNLASSSSRLIKTASSTGATCAASSVTTVFFDGTDYRIMAVH